MPPLVELSVALVGDRRMANLHEQFLGIGGPTDVLTFSMEVDEVGHVLAGEVVICVPEARREAKRRNIPLERELLLYALHGMLHLCGYDDRTAADFRMMHHTEDEILKRLGVGAVYERARKEPLTKRSHCAARGAGRRGAGQIKRFPTKRTQSAGAADKQCAARHIRRTTGGGAR